MSVLKDDLLVSLDTTAAALSDGLPCTRATITARLANAGRVSLGDAGSQSTELDPGDSIDVFCGNLNQVHARSTVAGDKVAVLVYEA